MGLSKEQALSGFARLLEGIFGDERDDGPAPTSPAQKGFAAAAAAAASPSPPVPAAAVEEPSSPAASDGTLYDVGDVVTLKDGNHAIVLEVITEVEDNKVTPTGFVASGELASVPARYILGRFAYESYPVEID